MNEEKKPIRITVRVPDKIGVYNLGRKARRRVANDLIAKNLKLFDAMRKDVSEIILVVDNKKYLINQTEIISIKLKMNIERRRKNE